MFPISSPDYAGSGTKVSETLFYRVSQVTQEGFQYIHFSYKLNYLGSIWKPFNMVRKYLDGKAG